ncbi:MAG: NAD(P)-dependent oxidoreductase [Candidatus Nanoarchaeia archaeon]|nr:NAD(P)-dependent oxidoreductase [Candidatus Nanoarchaeia archaeon]
MKIAFFDLEPWEINYFQKYFKKDVNFGTKSLTKNNTKNFKETEIISIFVKSKITKEILNQLPNLKFISTMSTGFDHIDLQECKKRNIQVSNVPQYGQNTIAEYTFSLLLALNRNLLEASRRTRKGNFDYQGLIGTDLKNKTIGIIGTGNIGQHVIKYAKAFDMKILAYDLYPNKKLEKELNFKYVNLNELYGNSDFISLHLPFTKSSYHFLDKKAFSQMKEGVKIINTSRGEIISAKDLIQALDTKKVSGCALDVLELENDMKRCSKNSFFGTNETKFLMEVKNSGLKNLTQKEAKILIQNHKLLGRENIILTPHLAFYTKEALERILQTTKDNILAFQKNKLQNLVN